MLSFPPMQRLSLFLAALFLGAALAISAPAADAPAGRQCIDCHVGAGIAKAEGGAKTAPLVSAAELDQSVHSTLDCVDCHEGYNGEAQPHKTPPTRANCLGCHDNLAKTHAFHPDFAAKPLSLTSQTDCADCHGKHGIQAALGKSSAFAGQGATKLCGECHEEAAKHFPPSAHGVSLASGHPEAPTCVSCHRLGVSRGSGDALRVKNEQARLCLSCHLSDPRVTARTVMGSQFIESYGQSVHGNALTKGNAKAANCVDCHGSHEMNRAMDGASRVNSQHIPATCARCHKGEAKAYGAGVHGAALAKGNKDAPVCTDCHREHDILVHTDPTANVSARNVSQMVCGTCHSSVKLSRRYGMPADRFQTFADSFHGLATRAGSTEAVNCASCHGAHEIRNSKDPSSPVSKANLARTCGQCHPGANSRFAVGSVHSTQTAESKDRVIFWIATIYVWMIVLIVGGMFVHNLMDFLRKLRRGIGVHKGLIAEPVLPHRLHLRMTVNERLQHAALVLSFALLVVTGFMLRFPEAWWVVWIRNWSDHLFEWRNLIHRFAAVLMVLAGLWHGAYLALTARGRQLFLDLLPRFNDFREALAMARYNLGFSSEKPRFGRFSYAEKAEYWALLWGSMLMGVTGAFLWFENTAIGLFTKLGYDICRTVHYYEAVLATLAIIVWHLYFVVFNPDAYPMNLAWLTGRLSEKQMHEDHPLELEQLKSARMDEAEAALQPPPEKPGDQPKP
jgi:cytochrome b subunit of formate dehydrogenase